MAFVGQPPWHGLGVRLERPPTVEEGSRKDLERYVGVVLDLPGGERRSTRARNIAERVGEFFEQGRGNDLPGVRRTWWAGYNAVTEYLSHERGRSQHNRLNSLWFGDG